MSVVKSKARRSYRSVSFQEAKGLALEVGVAVPVLPPEAPMPKSYPIRWGQAKKSFEAALLGNRNGSHSKVTKLLNREGSFKALVVFFSNKKRAIASYIFALVAPSVIFPVLPFLLFSVPVPETSTDVSSMVLAIAGASVMGFCVGAGIVGAGSVLLERQSKCFNSIASSFDGGYEETVALWAKQRYRVVIPKGAWSTPSDRVSRDIAYLGMKDGESVYCQLRPEGWVLTYNDGTELPVLANEKVLVKA